MQSFRVLSLHHVNVVVGDLEAAREFYCETLGLTEIDRPDFRTQGFWVSAGGAQVHVALGDEPAPRRHHFALAIDDFEAAASHLEALGHEVVRFPVVPGAGVQAGVRDPSGNLVELRQAE